MIQRLFSTFPDSWPGVGLLLLRAASGIAIVFDGVLYVWLSGEPASTIVRASAVASGVLLLLGLWTPVASTAAALLEAWLALISDRFVTHLVISIVALSLIALGPGAWSIDARLFGRRRIDV